MEAQVLYNQWVKRVRKDQGDTDADLTISIRTLCWYLGTLLGRRRDGMNVKPVIHADRHDQIKLLRSTCQ